MGMIVCVVRLSQPGEWLIHALYATLLSWQIAFLFIAWDPIRFRPLMIPAMLEKVFYVSTVAVLGITGQIPDEIARWLGGIIVHGAIGALFVAAFLRTPRASPPLGSGRRLLNSNDASP
jgi:hypothetical protein